MIRTSRIILTIVAFGLSLVQIVRNSHHDPSPFYEDREGASGALQSLDYWTRARAYPDQDVPKSAFYKAYEDETRKREAHRRVLNASGIWNPIGPTNLHGRCISVGLNRLNPNTVYLGTASGGLWRSYSSGLGNDWQQIAFGYPVLGVSAIMTDPLDSNVIYVGTGEVYRYHGAYGGLVVRTTRGSYGIGILKTTNGGSTWTKSLDWTYDQQRGIERLVMNPLNRYELYAATTDGVYKSTNAGSTWSFILSVTMAQDIVTSSLDTNLLMVSTGNFGIDAGILKSSDGGNNWISVNPTSFTGKAMLCSYESNPNIVYASIADSTTGVGGLWKSTNFGGSWTQVSNNGTNPIFGVQGWYSHYVIVHPTDSSLIIHNSVSLSKSTNGGVSFVGPAGGYSDNHGYAVDPINRNIVYGVSDDGIYRSTDFGSSWTDIGMGLQTGQLYNGFSSSPTDSFMAITQSQDHIPGYRYLGSQIWDHGSVTDEAGWTAIDQTNDNVQYAVNRNGTSIYKSTNRGATFTGLHSFSSGIGGWNSPFVVSRSNPSILYFGDTRVYKSTNGGSTWTATTASALDGGNTALSMAIATTSQDTVIVGMAPLLTTAHLYRTTNGGASWTNITGTLPNRYPIDLAIDPNDSKTMYAAMGGFGSGHLFKSTDAGNTWTDITGALPDAPATALAIDPLNSSYVYAGNDLGVYLSTNGGSSWTGFSEGLPDAVIVADLSISPANRALRCVTHGNGVYERSLYNGTPAATFDYTALAVNYPANGSVLPRDSAITGLKATFRNSGTQPQTDSLIVKFRIIKGVSELLSSTNKIAGLGVGISQVVSFNGSYTPTLSGTYKIEGITMAADQDPSNDTVRGTFEVADPPDVTLWNVSKGYCPYTEIVGGTPGPIGDDVQSIAPLPFPLDYDGVLYDSIQISTNGWVELGTGADGTFRGLSTAGQLGGFFRAVLATTDRPTKALGLWWGDLATGSSGAISYTTLGTAPDRVFVVQWKNVLANYNEASSTLKLNFQIYLYEGSSNIEYHYGPIVAGTFSGTGASIGLKDYVGGDYRYYDIARGASGLASELRTDLTPSSDWPGQDSCYHINVNSSRTTVSLSTGWNLVSEPRQRADLSTTSLFPTAISKAFQFVGTYKTVDSLIPGRGYWIKMASSVDQNIEGSPLATVDVSLSQGWNIIGTVDHRVAAPAGGLITSRAFGYSGGYHIVSALDPGRAYWVKSSGNGTITLGSPAAQRLMQEIPEDHASLTLQDNLGRTQSLYLIENRSDEIDPDLYSMPPVPPEGAFDVRFASGRILESFPANLPEPVQYQIQMKSAEYPLILSYDMTNLRGKRVTLRKESETKSMTHRLSGNGSMVLSSTYIKSLLVIIADGASPPARFSLKQNYPNPFNPTSTIIFDVPRTSHISVKVYDLLGREVKTLADGLYEAGEYRILADFSEQSSGIYFCRMLADNYSEVRKLLLAR